MHQLLREAVKRRASDLHITAGVPPAFRVNGQLSFTDHQVIRPADTLAAMAAITTAGQRSRFEQTGELDFVYHIPGLGRFRINVFRQQGATALVIRLIADKIPTLEELGHPEICKTLALKPRGLILVTGPAGSGKSTTLAAMIDLINRTRSCHIITLEDPIEYLHQHGKCIINQRELHADTVSFSLALRAALRADPDVILVGEMRDTETVAAAITAAETGHLVFASLHAGDAAQTISRMIDVFPPYQQQQIRIQLSLTLQGIVAQQLLPRLDGTGRIAAMEILVATPAIRNLIREGKTHQIISVLQAGGKVNMQTMDHALCELFHKGLVSYEAALAASADSEMFIRFCSSL